ncbi:MAG: EamA family transporter [Bacteroidales bacterium]|nr:EamA family transporter [Bacteroidales bacterium]MCR5276308.1 EamA family transporter [Bacteroidales bacterium]
MNGKSTLIGHLAVAGAYIIFGLNVILCKDIARSDAFSPIAIFTLRALFAGGLFWIASLFLPKEKVDRRDLPKIVLASFLGLFVPQMTFLTALDVSTAIDISIIGTFTPIFTMFFAAIFLKEPITPLKAGGVAVSFAGVLLLIFNSVRATGGVEHTLPIGFVLLLMNALSFASYLGAFRPLIAKYSVVTFMKWSFLASLLMSLPFSVRELLTCDYAAVPAQVYWEMGYLILFATFFAYFMIPYGQQRLRPTLVSMYVYLQPVVTAVIAIVMREDVLSWQKVCATLLIFIGVALVNRSRAAGAASGTGSMKR